MGQASHAITYIDASRMLRLLTAGMNHLFQRREYLNRINVFPVPDGDTGTNMAFTFKTIQDAISTSPEHRIDELMDHVAEAALDGARGNSGAIMAQYFHGFRKSVAGRHRLTAKQLMRAAEAGSDAAWKAMSRPVQGTLPTVLEAFSEALGRRFASGTRDIQVLFQHGLEQARKALANTPKQLPALREAGVVDAGGQGFVDLLDGIWTYIETGVVDPVPASFGEVKTEALYDFEVGRHRYCTECVVEGKDLDREAVMARMESLDASSLVVAGGRRRIRVHVHVNTPAEVYLACEEFGRITQQKADDMERQHGLLNQAGVTAVVVDSGADVPQEEIDRLNIHVVPVRLSFGDREFLDRVSLSSEQFYEMLRESEELPLTSQPPAQDFSRVYSLLNSHGYSVVSVGLSEQLSGTTAAARQAAGRADTGEVRVFDSLSASAGQGLLAIVAAEAAAMGQTPEQLETLLLEMRPQTKVIAVADDLSFGVRGGRVPAFVKRLADWLHINPVLMASAEGRIKLGGFHMGSGARPAALARSAVRKMKQETMYRVMIAHVNNSEGARETRQQILKGHGRVHSCHITEAGPALGVHLGLGGLIVGLMPLPDHLA
jgi:DegV family protein with EDD domain